VGHRLISEIEEEGGREIKKNSKSLVKEYCGKLDT